MCIGPIGFSKTLPETHNFVISYTHKGFDIYPLTLYCDPFSFYIINVFSLSVFSRFSRNMLCERPPAGNEHTSIWYIPTIFSRALSTVTDRYLLLLLLFEHCRKPVARQIAVDNFNGYYANRIFSLSFFWNIWFLISFYILYLVQ